MDEPIMDHGDAADEGFLRAVEAVLFAAHEPLPPSRLISLNGHDGWSLDEVVTRINARLESGHHTMRVRKVAGGYQMHILPEFGPIVESVLVKEKTQRLSRAGLETLAIIAYRQPCSTPDIERVRGVAADGVLRTLLERNLVTIKGRSEGPGRPLLYGTTDEFLRYFGLNAIDDLPREDELAAMLAARNEIRGAVPETTTIVVEDLGEQASDAVPEPRFRIRDIVCAALPELADG